MLVETLMTLALALVGMPAVQAAPAHRLAIGSAANESSFKGNPSPATTYEAGKK